MGRADFSDQEWAAADMRGGRSDVVGVRDHFTNFAQQFLAHHVVAQLDHAGVTLSVRAAMGLERRRRQARASTPPLARGTILSRTAVSALRARRKPTRDMRL